MWFLGLLATVVPTDPAGGYSGPNPHGNSLKAFRPGFWNSRSPECVSSPKPVHTIKLSTFIHLLSLALTRLTNSGQCFLGKAEPRAPGWSPGLGDFGKVSLEI